MTEYFTVSVIPLTSYLLIWSLGLELQNYILYIHVRRLNLFTKSNKKVVLFLKLPLI